MSRCRGCEAPIRWAKTASGKAMPLDATPNRDGNVVIDDTLEGPRARVVAPGAGQYMPHHATCPQVRRFR